MMQRFIYITEKAKDIFNSWTNKEKVWFHYLNPNGLFAEKSYMDTKINELVRIGKVKTYALLTYGVFNNIYARQLAKLYNHPRVRSSDYRRVVEGLERDIKDAIAFVKKHRR